MYWLRFCAVLLAFAFATHAYAVCHVPVKDKASVTALALKMAKSVGPCVDPNPSVLLALNLDNNMDPEARNLLVKQLKDDAVVKVSQNLTFSSGKAALYTLALRSSCFDPTKIPKPGGNLNLVTVLEEKTKAELTSIGKNKFPRTNFYQVALDVLALCVMSSPLAEKAGATLAKAVPAKPSGPEFSVDTAAMAVMGFTCVQSMDNIPPKTKSSVKQAQSVLLDLMMAQQNNNGMIGNIYSTGLAGQALTAAKAYYPREAWNCSLTLQKILEEIPIGTFSLPIAAAQVLPYLYGRSYFSVKEIQCPTSNTTLITVEYTIIII
uniref:Uncharacterized protein n=1 Tax=Leptobrachium leishanense TaxID=445787 RepID=A0A8C5QBF0_9ANUR